MIKTTFLVIMLYFNNTSTIVTKVPMKDSDSCKDYAKIMVKFWDERAPSAEKIVGFCGTEGDKEEV